MTATRLMLGRRPKMGQEAFGHVALNSDAQAIVEEIVIETHRKSLVSTPITYDPDDAPAKGEVMTHPLAGIDQEFQPAALWSLERAVTEITRGGDPTRLGEAEVRDGAWTFYALVAAVDGDDAIVLRATSPTRALKHTNRFITQLIGGELQPVKRPLVAVDYGAEAVVIAGTVYIFEPQRLERLLIDADEIKARAPQIVQKFDQGLSARLSPSATTWIQKACSENSNVGRRVERLTRTAALGGMTVGKLRAGLKDAKLPRTAFGATSNTIDIGSLDHAIALVDIAADLYYQPRFETNPRRVASFRRLR